MIYFAPLMEPTILPDEALWKKIVRKWFRLYFFTFLVAPAAYTTRAILANKLAIDDVGIFYSVLWFVTLISLYNDLGLTEALQYYLPKYRIEKKYNEYKTILLSTLGIQVISGFVIAGILFRWADRLAIHHFHSPTAASLLKIFCLYFIGINFLQVANSVFISFQNTLVSSITDFIRQITILWFILTFWLTNALLTPTLFAWGRIVGLTIAICVAIILFLKNYGYTLAKGKFIWNRSLLKIQFSYAFRVWISLNVWYLISQIDQQLIINFLGTESAGIYATYGTTLMIYGVLTGTLGPLLFPIVTELITKGYTEKFQLLQNLIYKYFSIFARSISGIFFAFGPEITSVFFGTKFAYSGQLVSYIAPFLTINMLMAINYLMLAWLGKIKQRAKFLVIALIVNIVLNLILIVWLDMQLVWALIATICSRCIMRWASFIELYRYQPIHIDRPYVMKNGTLIIALSLFFRYIKSYFFIASNAFRFQNIEYLIWAVCVYYLVISLCNITQIKIVIQQIKLLRQKI